jgi:NADPH-dependent curcumin reductase
VPGNEEEFFGAPFLPTSAWGELGTSMTVGTNRQWVLAKRPTGRVDEKDFRWTESVTPQPTEGQALVQNLWLSLDPTQILFTSERMGDHAIPIGSVMGSIAAGRIVQSKLQGFKAGDLVQGFFGWEDYSITYGGPAPMPDDLPMTKIPENIPLDLAIGALGITGMAAYFGVLEVGKPVPGETFVVSSAAGGVGSIAGQIAKIKGLHVIGITSGMERRDRLVRELGFDGAIDRLSEDVSLRLDALCPKGIDIFFDTNSLPSIIDMALKKLRHLGRVVLCGATPYYLATEPPKERVEYTALVMKRGRMEGLLAREYMDRFPEARKELASWIQSGLLKPAEDVVLGLENAPLALQRVFTGANFGKQLLKISD